MRNRKVGLLTVALGLIAIGFVIILQMIGWPSYGVMKYFWPFLIILFGL